MTKKRVLESLIATDAATQRWKATFSTARMAYEDGKLTEAERLLHRNLESANDLKERSYALPAAHIGLGAVYLAENKAAAAEKELDKAIGMLESSSSDAERELLAVALRFRSQLHVTAGDTADAERLLNRSIEILESLGEDSIVQLAYTLSDLASVHLAKNDLLKAEPKVTKALAILGNALGPDHAGYVRADMIYASLSPMSDDSRISTIGDGIQKMQYVYGAHHPNIARALHRYIKALEEKGETTKLEETKQRFAHVLK